MEEIKDEAEEPNTDTAEDLVDLVGIEPTTSSMPFPSTNCTAQTPSETE